MAMCPWQPHTKATQEARWSLLSSRMGYDIFRTNSCKHIVDGQDHSTGGWTHYISQSLQNHYVIPWILIITVPSGSIERQVMVYNNFLSYACKWNWNYLSNCIWFFNWSYIVLHILWNDTSLFKCCKTKQQHICKEILKLRDKELHFSQTLLAIDCQGAIYDSICKWILLGQRTNPKYSWQGKWSSIYNYSIKSSKRLIAWIEY